jgi:LacI family transcriptional regulator
MVTGFHTDTEGSLSVVTISDVARAAGVSKATVSRVLNNSNHAVNAATRQRVLEAMSALGFRPNALARSLYTKITHSVGLIIPDITNPYYSGIARGVEDVASQGGYTVLLCDTDRRPEKEQLAVNTLVEKRVEGIIVAGGGSAQASNLDEIARDGIGVVLVGKHAMEFPAVRVDNVRGAREATSHLIAQGHRHIACITGPAKSITSDERCQGYLQALADAGLTDSYLARGDFRPESGYVATRTLLARMPRPTAIFACNDLMALGALRLAGEMGLRVPADLALVGFDNIPVSSYLQPALTTVAVPMYELGTAAMTVLLQVVQGKAVPPVSWLELQLIVRESSKLQLS